MTRRARKPIRRKVVRRARANAALKAAHPKFAKLLNARQMDFFLSSEAANVSRLVDRILWLLRGNGFLLTKHQWERRERHLHALLLNLYAAYIGDKNRYVAIGLSRNEYSHRSRYVPSWRGYGITRNLVEALEQTGFIELERGFQDRGRKTGFRTRIRATAALASEFSEAGLKNYMVGRSSEFELIQLKNARKELVDYKDTVATDEMRQQLKELNQRIAQFFIGLEVSDQKLAELQIKLRGDREPLDFTERTLYRVFNDSSFEKGGRFYGGWWQQVPSQLRKYLHISDGPERIPAATVEMDFSSMQPSLAYTMQKLAPPKGIYSVPGYSGKRLQRLRRVLKAAMLRMLNTRSRPAALESLRKYYRDEQLGDEVPPAEEVLRLLEIRHTPIRGLFYKDTGKKLMCLESRIAAQIMSVMAKRGALVLPIHDSFIVVSRHRNSLMRAMRKAFFAETQQKCSISVEETLGSHYAKRVALALAQGAKIKASFPRRIAKLRDWGQALLKDRLDDATAKQLMAEVRLFHGDQQLTSLSPERAGLRLIAAHKKRAERFWMDYLTWQENPPAPS